MFIIVKIWNLIFLESQEYRKYSWLPAILWVLIPMNVWSYSHNLLENTMSFFTILSMYFLIKASIYKFKFFKYLIPSSICIVFGFLTKGPVALFPLSFFFLLFLVDRTFDFKKFVFYSMLLILFVAINFYLLTINNDFFII